MDSAERSVQEPFFVAAEFLSIPSVILDLSVADNALAGRIAS